MFHKGISSLLAESTRRAFSLASRTFRLCSGSPSPHIRLKYHWDRSGAFIMAGCALLMTIWLGREIRRISSVVSSSLATRLMLWELLGLTYRPCWLDS